MNKTNVLILLLLLGSLSIAASQLMTDRSVSTDCLTDVRIVDIPSAPTPEIDPPGIHRNEHPQNRDWVPLTSVPVDLHIPAGEALAMRINPLSGELEMEPIPSFTTLTDSSLMALDRAPDWLRLDLKDLLAQLEPETQDRFAGSIVRAVDPYVDEIAFAIAHSQPEFLESEYAWPELFEQNAFYIYDNDTFLGYVRVQDFGTAEAGGDYYSTTYYMRSDSTGATWEVEVPRDIYYWYIVHPKLSDEISAFIDPPVIENPHNCNIVGPEDGRIWREYIFHHEDPAIPCHQVTLPNIMLTWYFADSLGSTPVVWDGVALGTHGDTNPPWMADSYGVNNAMAIMNRWVWSVMEFGSNSAIERPHQPVRILKMSLGRCGEHQDLTCAVGRAALIPTACVSGVSADHAWNEFWDEGSWKVWETTVTGFVNSYINYDGDSNRWGSVFRQRSDGYFTDAIASYSGGVGVLRIHVTDAAGTPVDGAKILLAAESNSGGSFQYDNLGNTGQNGMYEFHVGEARNYLARIYAQGEVIPGSNSLTEVAHQMVDGDTVNFTFALDGLLPDCPVNEIDPPVIEPQEFMVGWDVQVQDEIVFGKVLYDDLSHDAQIRVHQEGGAVTRFLVNGDELDAYLNGESFNAWKLQEHLGTDQDQAVVTTDAPTWLLFHNPCVSNSLHLQGEITLFENSENISPVDLKPHSLSMVASPNPFNPTTTIQFTLPTAARVELSVFDIMGRKVDGLTGGMSGGSARQTRGFYPAGTHQIHCDGSGLPTGIYMVRLSTVETTQTMKLLLVR